MIFGHFLTQANESNAFVVACEETKEAMLIDVGALHPQLEDFLNRHGLRLTKVFITHDHYDHTGGLDEVVRRFGPEVYAGKTRAGGCKAHKVAHGQELAVGRLTGTALATPGHTPDGVCIVFPGMVFTGDTLFSGSIGGTSNPSQEIRHIKEHIFTLPPEYEIHTGHGPSSTVAIESQGNPFFVE